MFDVSSFIDRKRWTIADLANQLFESGGRSRVGMWKSGESSPRYAAILKLIDLGVTAEELFGKEYAEKLWKNSAALKSGDASDMFNSPEFREGMANADNPEFNAEVQKVVMAMKAKGMIK